MSSLCRSYASASSAASCRLTLKHDVISVISSARRTFHCTQPLLAGGKRYTTQELDILTQARQQGKTAAQISLLLPGRTEGNVRDLFWRLRQKPGLDDVYRYNKKQNPLTDAERQVIIDAKAEGKHLIEVTKLLPGRSTEQLRSYLHCSSLDRSPAKSPHHQWTPQHRWSSAEDRELRFCREHLGLTFTDIAKRIGARTEKACKSRYRHITPVTERVKKSRSKWTPEAVHELKNLLSCGLSFAEIANKIGRSSRVVQNKLSVLKYEDEKVSSDERPTRKWSAEEIEQLRASFLKGNSRLDTAVLLKRSMEAISLKANMLGLIPHRRASLDSGSQRQQQ